MNLLLDEFQGLDEELRVKIQSFLLDQSLKLREEADWVYNVLSAAYQKLGLSHVLVLGTVYRAFGTPNNGALTLDEKIISFSQPTYFGIALLNLLNDLVQRHRYDMCLIQCPHMAALILGSKQLLKLIVLLGAGNLTFNCFAHHNPEKSDIEIKSDRISFSEKFIRSRFHGGGVMHVESVNQQQFLTCKSEKFVFIPSLENRAKFETQKIIYICYTKI
jgi:hypothetical protein